jgi:hypothetical protein
MHSAGALILFAFYVVFLFVLPRAAIGADPDAQAIFIPFAAIVHGARAAAFCTFHG